MQIKSLKSVKSVKKWYFRAHAAAYLQVDEASQKYLQWVSISIVNGICVVSMRVIMTSSIYKMSPHFIFPILSYLISEYMKHHILTFLVSLPLLLFCLLLPSNLLSGDSLSLNFQKNRYQSECRASMHIYSDGDHEHNAHLFQYIRCSHPKLCLSWWKYICLWSFWISRVSFLEGADALLASAKHQ